MGFYSETELMEKTTGKKWDMVLYRFKTPKDTQSFIDYINTTNKDPLNSKAEDIPCQQIDNYRVLAPRGLDWYWLSATGNFDSTNRSIDWHRLTNFRHIAEVYENDRPLYDTWKKQGLIPIWALNKVIKNVKSR